MHIAALLLLAQAVGTVVRLAAGAEFPGWAIAIGPLVGALLWPLVSVLLLAPQRGASEVDETRPI
jgi:rod shape-determining protein MreD